MNYSTRIILSAFLMTGLMVLGDSHPAVAQALPAQQSGSVFTGKDAQDTIAEALTKAGAGEDIKVGISEARESDVIASAAGSIIANTSDVEYDQSRNHWQATLMLTADGRNLAPVKLTGHYDEMTAIPILKRAIQPGQIISEDDIDMSKQLISHVHKNIVTAATDIIGKSPKHVISQGRPIRQDEIGNPAIINKGSQVTLYYKSNNIEIKTFGEALESGALGDVIRVRNSASKVIIQGTVESNGRVRVTAPDTNSAEAL